MLDINKNFSYYSTPLCVVTWVVQTTLFFFFNILASLPLLLSTVYILLELPDLLKARLLCMFKYKSKYFFNGCIYFKVLEGRESEDVHVAEAAECMQEEVVFLWFCLVLL